ncbi:MAG: type I-G CRISPR-associated RAMP protein Csb1/Cas7g, partial [Acidimicrobiales bacterium]
MRIEDLYERVAAAASMEGDDGAIRVSARYDPASGAGTKVSPPTYPAEGGAGPYVIEERTTAGDVGVRCALLDSRQSQANRCEEELQKSVDDGLLHLPHLVLELETHGTPVRITSLTAPHRSRDAYFRDSLAHDGTRFDATATGAALLAGNPAAFYRHTPADLVYGVWDSHRQRRIQTRFPRIYTSELIGEGAVEGVRMAGRYDLLSGGTAPVRNGDLDWEPAEKGDK